MCGVTLMKKLKVYLETTVFNWYFEPEREFYNDIRRFFEEIAAGKFEAYASDYVVEELLKTQGERQKKMLELLNESCAFVLGKSEEAEYLASQYVAHKVISEKHSYDRLHVACAAVNGMDAIVSFNFSHINRLSTKEKTDLVNRLNGYPAVPIVLPMEVIEYDDV